MRNYEVTFIVDPMLSGDDVKATVQKYTDFLVAEGYQIVHTEETGLRELAYSIKKRLSGIYYTIEFAGENGNVIDKMEVNMRRDERLLRFLTVALDKFGAKYNQDKREGKIGKKRREAEEAAARAIADEAAAGLEAEGA